MLFTTTTFISTIHHHHSNNNDRSNLTCYLMLDRYLSFFSFLTQLHIVPGVSQPSASVPGGLCLYAVTASTFLTLHSPLSKHLFIKIYFTIIQKNNQRLCDCEGLISTHYTTHASLSLIAQFINVPNEMSVLAHFSRPHLSIQLNPKPQYLLWWVRCR